MKRTHGVGGFPCNRKQVVMCRRVDGELHEEKRCEIAVSAYVRYSATLATSLFDMLFRHVWDLPLTCNEWC